MIKEFIATEEILEVFNVLESKMVTVELNTKGFEISTLIREFNFSEGDSEFEISESNDSTVLTINKENIVMTKTEDLDIGIYTITLNDDTIIKIISNDEIIIEE